MIPIAETNLLPFADPRCADPRPVHGLIFEPYVWRVASHVKDTVHVTDFAAADRVVALFATANRECARLWQLNNLTSVLVLG